MEVVTAGDVACTFKARELIETKMRECVLTCCIFQGWKPPVGCDRLDDKISSLVPLRRG